MFSFYKPGNDELHCSNRRLYHYRYQTFLKIVIKGKTNKFLDDNNYFYKNQFGCRGGASINDAHFTVNKLVHENLDTISCRMDIIVLDARSV